MLVTGSAAAGFIAYDYQVGCMFCIEDRTFGIKRELWRGRSLTVTPLREDLPSSPETRLFDCWDLDPAA